MLYRLSYLGSGPEAYRALRRNHMPDPREPDAWRGSDRRERPEQVLEQERLVGVAFERFHRLVESVDGLGDLIKHYELGCEVKALGRGHIQRIKEDIRRKGK